MAAGHFGSRNKEKKNPPNETTRHFTMLGSLSRTHPKVSMSDDASEKDSQPDFAKILEATKVKLRFQEWHRTEGILSTLDFGSSRLKLRTRLTTS